MTKSCFIPDEIFDRLTPLREATLEQLSNNPMYICLQEDEYITDYETMKEIEAIYGELDLSQPISCSAKHHVGGGTLACTLDPGHGKPHVAHAFPDRIAGIWV